MPIIPIFMALAFFTVILIALMNQIWWLLVIGIIGFIYPFYWVWKNSPWR